MQLVIDISQEEYKHIMEMQFCFPGIRSGEGLLNKILYAIRTGTPLPKGHGRLIDISKIEEDRIESDNPILYLTIDGEYTEAISLRYLDDLPTLIEAESEG